MAKDIERKHFRGGRKLVGTDDDDLAALIQCLKDEIGTGGGSADLSQAVVDCVNGSVVVDCTVGEIVVVGEDS